MSKQKQRVALITAQDPTDLKSWSGTHYHIYQQLLQRYASVEPLGPVKLGLLERLLAKVARRLCHVIFKKYNAIHSLLDGYLKARHFSKKLRQQNYTMVFASACSPVVAFLKTDIPVVYLSDATFNLLLDYYEQFSGLSRWSVFEGQFAEQKAIEKSAAVLMSSEWARQSAIGDYGAVPDKVKTCLFGANIDIGAVARVINIDPKTACADQPCNLLFLARDWHRKGGQVALDTFFELKRRGYLATLTICGCEPEHEQSTEGLEVIPYLDKGLESDCHRYQELMNKSHFLVLPTIADCTPMVFAEANAYGMPVITTDTGGISSIIQQGENGYLLPEEAGGKAYADTVINAFFENSDQYRKLVQSSKEKQIRELNWDNWGECAAHFTELRLAGSGAADITATENKPMYSQQKL